MATIVTGEMSVKLGNQFAEIQRQLYLQRGGYPYDPEMLSKHLQLAIEGKFVDIATQVAVGNNLSFAIGLAEHQADKLFGYKANIAEMFALPEVLPWKEVIAILQPSGVDNRQAVNSLQKYGLSKAYEEVDVNKYKYHEASDKPRLFLIERNPRPTKNTMGKSPNTLVKTGRLWLPLKVYALAFGQYYEATNQYLDPETWTWFPTERLSDGEVAYGYWNPSDRNVRFHWINAGGEIDGMGAREAIEVPLKP
ncbi:MAG: hypothetical protein WC631_02710 [Candidatus Paceibacterota bacterium]|jgi:hypothetical protein